MKPALRYVLLFFILLFLHTTVFAEPAGFVLHGKTLEQGTGKPLEGMTVFFLEDESNSVISDHDGGFALSVKAPGNYSLVAVGMGYKKSSPVTVSFTERQPVDAVTLRLDPVFSLKEVVVQGERNQDKTAKTVITGKELTTVAGSAGDPLRGMQALPGITTGSDASSEPAIRGSGPHNNAYYVDFLPVGYLFHMGGLVSVINADLVDDFNIYASSFGPEFGDVTGGVIDVKLRNPRTDRIGGKINLSTLEADALLEGPVNETQSFYIGVRRSYIDLFMPKHGELGTGVEYLQFPQYEDYQAKYVWNLSKDQTLTFQASGAQDRLKLTLTSKSDAVQHDPILAGDVTTDLSYDTIGAILTSRFSSNVSNKLGISWLGTRDDEELTQLGYAHVKEDRAILRDQLDLVVNSSNTALIGVDYALAKVKYSLDVPMLMPSEWDPNSDYTDASRFIGANSFAVNSLGLSFKDRWKAADPVTLVVGGRASYEDYFDRSVAEPRLSVEYALGKDTLLTAGWGRYHQFPEGYQVVEGYGNPHLGYEKAEHYDLGVEQQISDGWSFKVEEYYKKLYDLVVPYQPTNYINGGSGTAYGTEMLIKKDRTAAWWGWLSLSYSRTKRHNDLTGEDFAYPYDQPYIVNVVYNWKISPKWTFGAKWRYQSGAPFTPVVGSYTDASNRILPVYGSLGSERLPAYHRLDLRISAEVWSHQQKITYYVDLINAYNHENISGYEYNADYTSRKPVTELPIMPAVGVQLEF